VVDYLAFKRDWISRVASDPNRLALIEAAGDSMMPTINSGDLLLLDLCINRIEQDAIYAISVDGMLYIKRIQKRLDGTVIVKSDNPNYEEQRFTADEAASLRIVGRVHLWPGLTRKIKLRLEGIDTPEKRGSPDCENALAWKATRFTRRFLGAGGFVRVTDVRLGKYAGRALGRIVVPGKGDLGRALLAAGLAREYRGGRRGPWCGE